MAETDTTATAPRFRSKPNPKKELLFDQPDHPLEVEIKVVGNGGEIQPTATQRNIMKARMTFIEPTGKSVGQTGEDEWQTRGFNHGQNHSPFIRTPPPGHFPIVMLEGEWVKITCPQGYAFEVDVVKDPDSKPDPAFPGPDRPFVLWTGPQNAAVGGYVLAQVAKPPLDPMTGIPTMDGPREQRFYKFTAKVQVGATLVPVDPDGFCDR